MAKATTGGLVEQTANRRRNVTTRFGKCTSKSLVVLLVSLSVLAVAASSPNFYRPQQPVVQSPEYKLVQQQQPLNNDDSTQFAFVETPGDQGLADAPGEDPEVNQFLERLILARRLLDERLARETAEQQQIRVAQEADSKARYKLLDNNDDSQQRSWLAPENDQVLAQANRLAAQLQLADQQTLASDGAKLAQAIRIDSNNNDNNPSVYYNAVSLDTPTEQQQARGQQTDEFAGDFGEPLVKPESQTRKRETAGSKPRLTTLLENEESAAANSGAAGDDARVTFGQVVEAPGALDNAAPSYIGSLFASLRKRLAPYWPTWAPGGATLGEASQTKQVSGSSSVGGLSKQLDESANKSPEIGLPDQHDAEQRDKASDSRSANRGQIGEAKLHFSAPDEIDPHRDDARPNTKAVRVPADEPAAAHKRVHVETASALGPAAAESQRPESLVGKYVYAPAQHYYWTGAPLTSGPWHSDESGGEGHLRPAYAFQKDASERFAPLVLSSSTSGQQVANKSPNNDLYFLVMVGAFCMMAVAVVLAAGLFAYRVQQQRRSSQAEPEYPTYGVVGPNNMHAGHRAAKCGAAAFVGGYLAAPPVAGNFASQLAKSTKVDSAKHVSDLCRQQGGGDSGLASLERSCSSKKSSVASSSASHVGGQQRHAAQSQDAARMYHYQHQKQQMIVAERASAGRHTSASDLDSDDDENDDGSYTVYECPGLASAHEMEIKNPLFNDERTP